MTATLIRVSETELENFKNDSDLFEKKFYGNDATFNKNSIDVDKAWDGIIYLLTGKSFVHARQDKLSKVFFSEQFLDEEQDLGYGPAQYLTTDQVKALDAQLSTLSESRLQENFNPQDMEQQQVYPGIWDEGQESLNYLLDYYKDLKAFYNEASKNNQAVITVLC